MRIKCVKNIITIMLTVWFFLGPCINQVLAAEVNGKPQISASAAILVDAKTGQILYGKNAFKRRAPASTTKILTALIVAQSGKLNDTVVVSRKAAYTNGSSMGLRKGQQLKLADLLYGALMQSGNDACVAMAEYLGGNVEHFAEVMNMKSMSLGTVESHFVNPHGLHNPNHYTCAYDLALIARNAIKNSLVAKIVSTRVHTLEIGEKEARSLANTNRLLWSYIWADGIKTGTTSAAGECLISSATKGNRQLIAVVLKSGNRWSDSIKLFEYGFKDFEYKQLAVKGVPYSIWKVENGVKEEIPVVYAGDYNGLLPKGDTDSLEKHLVSKSYLIAPVQKGEIVGRMEYYVQGKYLGSMELLAGTDVEEKGLFRRVLDWIKSIVYEVQEFIISSRN